MDESDADVLGRARAGDERAFLALYRAAQPDLLRYLSVLVGEDAETVANATWEVVACDLSLFAGSLEGFRGWVAGVGRRLALEHLAAADPATAGTTSEIIPGRAADALRLLSSLPGDQAEAIALRSVMHLDEDTSAGIMGIRTSDLRRRARLGLVKLAARLKVSGSTESPTGRASAGPTTVTLPHALAASLRPAGTYARDVAYTAAVRGPSRLAGNDVPTMPIGPRRPAALSNRRPVPSVRLPESEAEVSS